MKKIELRNSRVLRPVVLAALGAVLMSAALPVRAWEVGYMGTVIKGRSSGGTGLSYGGSVMLQEDLCRYADAGVRVGYTKSDCFKVRFVPVELTASLKYPLLEDRLVPYVGFHLGYHIFTGGNLDLEDTLGYYPVVGLNWRLGKERRWSLFIEATYRFLTADITAGGAPGETKANLDGGGGSFGFSYRF